MLDLDFFEFIEYFIGKTFEHSDNLETTGFWCDGVMQTESDDCYSQKFVNENRQITLQAFIGKDGQSEYELTLKFGDKALSQFARNLDIKDCFPNPDKPNWFNIDTNRNKIEIQLD